MAEIYVPVEDHDIEATFPLMVQLRPDITADSYLSVIRELATHSGYQLAGLRDRQQIKAIAGFPIGYSLACGKYLYIDDLVTDQASRSKGYGSALLNWLEGYAQQNGCNELDLDSGVQLTMAGYSGVDLTRATAVLTQQVIANQQFCKNFNTSKFSGVYGGRRRVSDTG